MKEHTLKNLVLLRDLINIITFICLFLYMFYQLFFELPPPTVTIKVLLLSVEFFALAFNVVIFTMRMLVNDRIY
ncbi:hypothetical protein FACS1894130_03410 [Spirochaetia bacterium]|nr:hypothetical protein FACS1894130_03410 [Spirochaetia bacterium]